MGGDACYAIESYLADVSSWDFDNVALSADSDGSRGEIYPNWDACGHIDFCLAWPNVTEPPIERSAN